MAIDNGETGSRLSAMLTLPPRFTSSRTMSAKPMKQAIPKGRPGTPWPSFSSTVAPRFECGQYFNQMAAANCLDQISRGAQETNSSKMNSRKAPVRRRLRHSSGLTLALVVRF
jgi:hypothetical protein